MDQDQESATQQINIRKLFIKKVPIEGNNSDKLGAAGKCISFNESRLRVTLAPTESVPTIRHGQLLSAKYFMFMTLLAMLAKQFKHCKVTTPTHKTDL